MPTVDFTLDDLKQVFATKPDLERFATKDDVEGVAKLVKRVTRMLEEDYQAEVGRVDRIDKRLTKLEHHIYQTPNGS